MRVIRSRKHWFVLSLARGWRTGRCWMIFAMLLLSLAPSRGMGQASGSLQQATPQSGQAGPPAGTYTLQVNAQAVVLDVVVTDKKGKPVTNLGKDDFQIYEDKVPQTVRSFDAPVTHPEPANIAVNSTMELDKLEPTASVTILVLDEINTRFEDELFARYSLKKFLDAQGETLTQPTLLVAVDLQRFTMLHDYTTSRKDLLAALEHHLVAYPWRQGGGWKTEQFNAAVASIMEIAEATAGHPGHKSMIWIGRGFPSFDPESLSPEADAALQTTIETCTNGLRDSRVVLYTLDSAGVSTAPVAQDDDGFYTDDPFGGQIDFNAMALATGGESFFGRNDVDRLIAASALDGASFYTLSFTPTLPITDAKIFHNLRVVMRNPDLRAATREGYYSQPAKPAPARSADGKLSDRQVFDLMVAGQSTMVYDAVPLTVLRMTGTTGDFKVSLSSADVTWQTDGANKLSANVTLLVESFDKKGKLLDRQGESTTVEVPRDPDAATPGTPWVTLLAKIPTKPPAARIRFVVRLDDSGKLGSSNFLLVDPATLSGP